MRAVDGTITNIDDPNAVTTGISASNGTLATAINNSGVIAGSYRDGSGIAHGFVLSAGTFTNFDPPGVGTCTSNGVGGTSVQSIDPAGDVAGNYYDTNCAQHGYLRTANGTITTFTVSSAATSLCPTSGPGSLICDTQATGIGPAGDITGGYVDSNDVVHGLLRAVDTGNITSFDEPNAGTGPDQGTEGFRINAAGTIAGVYADSNGVLHGFLYTPALTGTTTTLSPAPTPNTSVFGEPVTLSATVSSSSGAPPNGESVTFLSGASSLGAETLSGGAASLTTTALPVGTDSITAVYGGDSDFGGSTSAAVNQVVGKAGTSVTLGSWQNPSASGQSVTFTATISGQFGGVATGSVTFNIGSTSLGSVAVSANSASLTITGLPAGTDTITGVYSGDSNFAGSTSNALSQVVNAPPVGVFGDTAIGNVSVSASSGPIPLTITFNAAETLGSIAVLTQGAPNLDFTNAGGGTCAAGTAYTAGESCMINVKFSPKAAGARYGAVQLLDGAGNVFATGLLAGTGVAPEAAFRYTYGSTAPPVVISSADIPYGDYMTVDAVGNLYLTNNQAPYYSGVANGSIVEFPVSGSGFGAPVVLGSALPYPQGVAVDGAGNIYALLDADANYDPYSGSILEYAKTATGYAPPATVASGLSYPNGLAMDGAGNLFFASYSNGFSNGNNIPNTGGVQELPWTGAGFASPVTLASGLNFPGTLILDAAGDIFVTIQSDTNNDANSGGVVELSKSGGGYASPVAVISGLNTPTGITVDPGGSLLAIAFPDAANTNLGTLLEFPSTSAGYGAPVALVSGLTQPTDVKTDSSGNILILAYNTDVYRIPRPTAPSLVFASTPDGEASSNSPQTVTLENIGNAPLTFPVPSSGNNPSISANFTLNSSGESACPAVTASSSTAGTLAAGGNCVLAISFTPTAPATGTVTGSLSVTDTNLNAGTPNYAIQSIQLQGTAIAGPSPAILLSPTPGLTTVLGTSNVSFQWTSGTGVSVYQLNLSAIAPGDGELFTYKGTATSATAPSLPANGVTVYARLYSYLNGAWQYNDSVYTESGTPLAVLQSPTPGLTTVLGTSNVQFQWTAGTGVSVYQLNLSAIAPGDSELFTYKGTATAATATSLPANGITLYARLYSYRAGAWQYNDYVYTESGTPLAVLQSPTPGLTTVLGTSNVQFQWSGGTGVIDYQLNLSAIAPGDSELFTYKGSATSATVPTLPADGVTVYARLYSYRNGAWQFNDYVYTESGATAAAILTFPSPGVGTVLGTSNVLFQWSEGTGATLYQLNLSAVAPGGSELYLYKGSATTATAPTLPANGVKVYARLYSYIDKTWRFNDYVYSEQ
jgi:hypothetical protein